MTATNVDVVITDYIGIGGNASGIKLGVVDSKAKGAQNDTITISNASSIIVAELYDDTTGVLDPATISSNILTMTGVTTGTVSGTVLFKE